MTDPYRRQLLGRWGVFLYSIGILAVLLCFGLRYAQGKLGFLSVVPREALLAAWAGALGGVAISFKGVFDHTIQKVPQDREGLTEATLWNNEWLPWHLGRPFTGIIVGIFVFIALKAVSSSNPPTMTLAAGAFVLGTQERKFFEFVNQVGGLVLSVAKKEKSAKDTPPAKPGAHT